MDFHKIIEFSDHSGPVYSISKHFDFLFSSGADRCIAKWDLKNRRQDNFSIRLENLAYNILHCVSIPCLIIGCSNGDLHVIDIEKKTEVKFIKHHQSALFSILEIPEKNLVLSGDSDGNICVWEIPGFKLILQIPLNCGKIRQMKLSADGKYIMVSSKDGKIRIIDTSYFNLIHEIQLNQNGIQSCIETGENILVAGYDGFLYVLEKENFEYLRKIPAHKGPIYSIISLNEQLFLTGSRDKSIKIWNLYDFSVIEKKEIKTGGHKNSVNQLLKLNQESFASCSDDGKIIIWQKGE